MIAAIGFDSDDLRLWMASAAVVLAVHAAGTAMLLRWHEPLEGDDGSAIVVELAPDLPPGPEQAAVLTPEPQPETPVAKLEEKVEPPPPVPEPEVVMPTEPIKPPEKTQEEPMPPAPATAPPRPSAARVASWHRQIVLQIERHKGYPAVAQARHQMGIAQLAFTINRQGRVVASRVAQSSGHPLLDQETIATVQRAQPFPPPPPNMAGETFDFTVPMRFNIK
jgi:periplasmic protein TonB